MTDTGAPKDAAETVERRASVRRLSAAGLAHLSVVYVVWGSTYLAIRIAVREGSGFPPLNMAFTRTLVAGVVLLLWAKLRGDAILPSRKDLLVAAASGLLFWLGGNGLVVWAEQRADSGLAALLVASTPIWAALAESLLDRRLPSRGLVLALLVGFGGIAVLSMPSFSGGKRGDALAVGALIGASLLWSLGAILQSRTDVKLSARASSGYQHLIGGLGLGLFALALGEARPTPTSESLLAWVYLVVFGSLVGFTSYIQTLRLLPTSVAMTNAYVNPVLAVVLGVVVLNEPVTLWTIAGAVMVLLGVVGVFRER